MAENESVAMAEEVMEEVLEEMIEEADELAVASPTPEPAEKPGLLGQTPSMWFLIDTGVVFLIVLIMRLTA